jgi:glycerophosphoryl diester phosphodiesterase
MGTLVCLAICSVAAGQEQSATLRRPLIVGHRGLMQAAPENTLAAFRACLALKVGFEFDVRRTKDGQLVCLHDDTLERTTDGHGKLAELTAAELALLEAGGRFDAAFKGERIPTVEQIVRLIGEQSSEATLIAVDLKEAGSGIEEEVVRMFEKHGALSRLIFIGLTIESPEVRSRLKAASPKAQSARLALAPERIAEVLADRQADWVYVRFLPQPEQVRRIHEQGKRLFIAGPLVAGHEADNWMKAAELGFDAVLTDYPLEMQRLLR